MSYLASYRKVKRRRSLFGFAIVGILVLAGFLGVGGTAAYASTETHQTCQVQDKDRSTDKSGGSVYRVYTSCGVFSVEDDPFRGRFNSADTYAGITKGATYDLRVIGWRNGFLSMFPNILDATQAGHE